MILQQIGISPFVFYRSSLCDDILPPKHIQTPRGVALQLLSAHSTQISGVATEATSQKPFGTFNLRTFCDLSHVCNPHVTNDTLSVLSNIENITSQQNLYIAEAAIKAIQALVNFSTCF